MGEDEQKGKAEFYFNRKNYFLRFTNEALEPTNKTVSKSVRHALEYFVDDLRKNRMKTIERFISEPTIEEMFRSIAQLLLSPDDRICGDSAYILGSVIEIERGLQIFLAVFSSKQHIDIIRFLSELLSHRDTECILNAAGTLGTICSSKEGRHLLVHHTCVSQVIANASTLLSSKNPWIASNAALVLARITVEDEGCQMILSHSKHREVLKCLLDALDMNDIHRSTNIAFAIARLVEGEEGKRLVIDACGQDKFFEALLIMLETIDSKEMHKNACYTLSSFCTSEYGFELCIQSLTIFHRILIAIQKILLSKEHETVWFALMCLRAMAKYDGASEYLCSSGHLLETIEQVQNTWSQSKQIQDEAKIVWFMIHRGIKPDRPTIDECRDTSADISWPSCSYYTDEASVQYRILLDDIPLLVTTDNHCTLKDLKTNTSYGVRVQYVTKQGDSAISDPTFFHTEDYTLPSIHNLHVARATMTALRIVWELTDASAGTNIKGYQVYLNSTEYEMTHECGLTISSLLPNTEYTIEVCAVSATGHGPRASIHAKTSTVGDSVPAPPIFTVVGRRELHIKWQPPEVIPGRLNRYDLFCNERCIYSGIDQEYHATMLKPDTEYTIEVVAITNEGRFRSRPAKTRTLKDEYPHSNRQTLYESSRSKRTETNSTKKSSNTATVSEKSSSKDTKSLVPSFLPNQNIQITTVRAVHFKTESYSPRAGLPGLYKTTAIRPMRTPPRFRTATKSFTQPRISASVIIPTLDIDHSRDVAWPGRIKAYRYPL